MRFAGTKSSEPWSLSFRVCMSSWRSVLNSGPSVWNVSFFTWPVYLAIQMPSPKVFNLTRKVYVQEVFKEFIKNAYFSKTMHENFKKHQITILLSVFRKLFEVRCYFAFIRVFLPYWLSQVPVTSLLVSAPSQPLAVPLKATPVSCLSVLRWLFGLWLSSFCSH